MPRFQKRHYEAIADVFADMRAVPMPLFEVATLNQVLCKLADRFAEDNPQFNRARFLDASALPIPRKTGCTHPDCVAPQKDRRGRRMLDMPFR
jgi:hypothetical protein